jgi:allophanate hydrolase subunit 1
MQLQEGAPFTHPMYRAAFEQLRQLYANDVEYLLPALDEAIPGMAQLTIAYNFEDEGFDARELVDSLLYRLRESALERKIRIIRSDLQKDGEDSKDHLQALADASQELHRIRAKRFQ